MAGTRPDVSHRRIRTFHARHGRVGEAMRATLDRLGPRHGLDARTDTTRPLVVEVGCGFGEAALGFAAAHHDVDLLATDVHHPGVAALLAEVDAAAIPNLFVERGDAVDLLDQRVPTGGLAGVHVFFPDPWPKVRHHKRRFIRPDLLELCADRMAAGAALLFATDVADYARWAQAHLDHHPAFDGGPVERPAWRPVTRYEQQAVDAGRRIVDLAYRRR